ncbi:MAG: [acyl-carrier-protein] S-malonyltransferase [Rhizobiales bacterium TMED83]|jgi:[acyl-carrier-protein] S-malonyltransferase|nr:[acyl-carrier-protein] S-malonyltransferase [Rhodobiaceae bacterium]RPF94974.1 MAG: [acyl-carrier-protein] S-malonyltransferase [Rhizobiales bacterium TMED83]HCD17202.1 [acyl-carrier-protein] S-malonyltransferase [Rhodobiaceae bacterium]
MKRGYIFPGQGSQSVGMGRALAEEFGAARDVFAAVDDALDQKLSQLMWDGPESELTLTENAQPALMAVSMAVLRVLAENGIKLSDDAAYVAGHSLGEYSALTGTGALELADAARLLKLRGQAMQRAVPVGVGAMAALLGLEFEAVVEVAEQAEQGEEICAAANDNAVGQVVVSGHAAAVARAIDLAKERGAKRAMELPVSAPFHCALMQPAAEEMQAALAETKIVAPSVPVIANVRAAPVSDPEEIRSLLVEQITERVRWRESMIWLADNAAGNLVELGSGKVLTTMARRIDPRLSAQAISTPDDISAYLEENKGD